MRYEMEAQQIVNELNDACQSCEEGQSMVMRPFTYRDDGFSEAVLFLDIPLWDSEGDPLDEDESLRDFLIQEANSIMNAIGAIAKHPTFQDEKES